jgi:hypothetical protein
MEVSGQLHAQVALSPVPIGQEAGWAPDPVWTMWRGEKSFTARNRTPGRPALRHTDRAFWAHPLLTFLFNLHLILNKYVSAFLTPLNVYRFLFYYMLYRHVYPTIYSKKFLSAFLCFPNISRVCLRIFLPQAQGMPSSLRSSPHPC